MGKIDSKNMNSSVNGAKKGIKKVSQKDAVVLNEFDGDIFSDDFAFYIDQFCRDNNIDDLKKENNNIWCACMMYLYDALIKNKYNLKDSKLTFNSSINTNFNRYNYELIYNILNIYTKYCYLYNKDISIYNFALLTNINIDTIYNWQHGEVTSYSFRIWQKLHNERELMLTNKLSDGKQNPVGVIAILNHSYNWQTSAAASGTKQEAKNIESLPTLQDAPPVLLPGDGDN